MALGQVTLLGRLLHGPTSTDHHPRWSSWLLLLLLHVGPGCCYSRCPLGLRWHPLGPHHPHLSWVPHAHLLTLGLLVVRVWRHHACSCLGCLSLQGHLPLGIGDLLDLHGNLYSRWRRARLGRLLLLTRRLTLPGVWRLWASNTSGHNATSSLLLGWCCRAQARFSLRLVEWGGAGRPVCVGRQAVGMLLRWQPSSTLLLLNRREQLLLVLGGVHHPSWPTCHSRHLLELVVEVVLGGHATLWGHSAGLLLAAGPGAHALLGARRHHLSRGLGRRGLGAAGRGRAGGCDAVAAR